jgi:hypothetical protein
MSKLAGIEMIPGGWHSYRLAALLLEEHKNEPVDTNVGLWALVVYYLSPCSLNGPWLFIQKNE